MNKDIKQELKEKSQYFRMVKICEKAQVNYQVYKNWKYNGLPLSDDKIIRLLNTMKEVSE